MTFQIAIFTFGAILLLIGLVGKVVVKDVVIGTDSKLVKGTTILLGIFFIILSFTNLPHRIAQNQSQPTPSPTNSPVTPTPKVPISTPSPTNIPPTPTPTVAVSITPNIPKTPTLHPTPTQRGESSVIQTPNEYIIDTCEGTINITSGDTAWHPFMKYEWLIEGKKWCASGKWEIVAWKILGNQLLCRYQMNAFGENDVLNKLRDHNLFYSKELILDPSNTQMYPEGAEENQCGAGYNAWTISLTPARIHQ